MFYQLLSFPELPFNNTCLQGTHLSQNETLFRINSSQVCLGTVAISSVQLFIHKTKSTDCGKPKHDHSTVLKKYLWGLSQDIDHHLDRQANSDLLHGLYTPAVCLKGQRVHIRQTEKVQGFFFFSKHMKDQAWVFSSLPHHSGFWQRAERTALRKGQPCWHGDRVWLTCPCTTGPVWTSPLPGDICSYRCAHEATWHNPNSKRNNKGSVMWLEELWVITE